MHQVIIVGAGPAGAYLAYLLSREGINVLLLEKEHLPRYKPCGGGLTPRAMKLLDFDLGPIIEDTIFTIIFTHHLARPIIFNSDRPIIYMISRERFDTFLVEQAKKAGAEVLEGIYVKSVEMDGNGVSVHADGAKWQGQIVVGADGAKSIIAHSFGLAGNKRMAVAIEAEVPVSTEIISQNLATAKADYGLVPGGYAWVFPKTDHLSLGVGSISPKIKDLKTYLLKMFQSEGLTHSSLIPKIQGWTIPVCTEPKNLDCDRAMVIGDAAGLANIFTGEGIYAALFSALLGAQVITEQIKEPRPDLHRYTRLVKEKMGEELSNATHITRLFYPASGLVHRVLEHRQGLATDFIQVIGGDMNYASFLGSCCRELRDIIKSS